MDEIALEEHREGTILPVKAQAGARRSEVRGTHDGALRVSVTQVAEKGKANKAIQAELAKALKISKSRVELWSGESSTSKRFLVRDVSVEKLRLQLTALLGDSA